MCLFLINTLISINFELRCLKGQMGLLSVSDVYIDCLRALFITFCNGHHDMYVEARVKG